MSSTRTDRAATRTAGPTLTGHLGDAWHTVAPRHDDPHGPLPGLLVPITVVTGLVDAFSYLELGRVFVANMTGNVVFLSFALGGTAGFLWWASLLAVFAFLAAALLGGRITHSAGGHRGRHLLIAAAAQSAITFAAFLVAVSRPLPYDDRALSTLIILLGIATGLQNATARALAVPDLTTTVLTLTLTGIPADSSPAGGTGSRIGRRLVAVACMFLGAVTGAPLVHAGDGPEALLLATGLLLTSTVIAATTTRTRQAGRKGADQPCDRHRHAQRRRK
jgi:uncharacterized membrane protein YoaK (UPF0700 family)